MAKKQTEELDYYTQQSKNEYAFREMLKNVKPDLFVIFDLMEKTSINPLVLIKTMRQLHNIATGNGYGTVTINIENKKAMFVRGEESDKINELVILEREKGY